jgi:hypothetical protein
MQTHNQINQIRFQPRESPMIIIIIIIIFFCSSVNRGTKVYDGR